MQVGSAMRRAAGALGIMTLASGAAHAGGFALREQSAYGLGSAYAGIAAGGSLSSMFWNPATMTQFAGIQSESVVSAVLPYASHTVKTPSTLGAFGGAGDSGIDALLPGSYASMQIGPKLWLGLSVNTPFGLSVRFPDVWAGRNYAEDTKLSTYNATPSIAYQLTDWLSIGAGLQIQYAKADLASGIGAAPGALVSIEGAGWGIGATAGVTVKPTPTTTIGVGWRSGIDQKINGTLSLPAGVFFNPPFSTPGSVSTTINLPDTVSVGLRQQLGPQWTLLATIEWSNWSRIGTAAVLQPNGQPALVLNGLGGGAVTLPFKYRDGWFYSAGAEYKWSDVVTLRAGLGYERSPISDDVRTPRLPDNDRYWVTLGSTFQVSPKLSIDLAYAHLFVKDTDVNVNSTANPWFNGAIQYTGSVNAHVDIVSVGLKYRWDTPAAPAKLITKG